MDTETRCGIYARVSTKDKGQDFENQLLQLRQFAERMGWRIVAEYCDRKSAKNTERVEFQRMMADASRRSFDVLLFWSLDRICRSGALDTLQILQQITEYGVNYRSYTEQYLDSTGIFREAIIGILGCIAKQERVRLSERVTAGLARAAKEG